jgi:polyphenol oxidase
MSHDWVPTVKLRDGAAESRFPVAGGRSARVRFTSRADGDLAATQPLPVVAAVRARVLDRPWTWLRQVHGSDVVLVERAGYGAGAEADASVTRVPGAVLAIQVADCAPLALVSAEGVVGAVHVGWRGLAAGVVPAAAEAMRAQGATELQAVLGPCIHPECYEFGAADLEALVAQFGPEVRSTTAAGTPALDLPAAVRAALHQADVHQMSQFVTCTACHEGFFSHRARGEAGRQALLVWLEDDQGETDGEGG